MRNISIALKFGSASGMERKFAGDGPQKPYGFYGKNNHFEKVGPSYFFNLFRAVISHSRLVKGIGVSKGVLTTAFI